MERLLKRKFLILQILCLFAIGDCQSAVEMENIAKIQEEEKLKIRKENIRDFYDSVGFEYFDQNSHFILNRGLPNISENVTVLPKEYLEISQKSWMYEDEWKMQLKNLYKKDFGNDPFLRREVEEAYRSLYEKKAFYVLGYDFSVSKYDIEKEVYSLPVQVTYDIPSTYSNSAIIQTCGRMFDIFEIPLKRVDAEKFRSLNSTVFLHFRKMPTPKHIPLSVGTTDTSYYLFNLQLLKVSFIGANDLSFDKKFQEGMPFNVSFNINKNKSLFVCKK